MKSLKFSSLASCLVFALSGCSSDDSDGGTTVNGASNAASLETGLSLPAEYHGSWHRSCQPEEQGFTDEEYTIVRIDITANTLVKKEQVFSDSLCTTPLAVWGDLESGYDVAVQAGTVNTSSGPAIPIDIQVTYAVIDGKDTPSNEKWYDITKIIDGKLYFGDGDQSFSAGLSSANRITELDYYNFYERN